MSASYIFVFFSPQKLKLFRYGQKRRKAVKTEKKQQQVSFMFLHGNSIAGFI